MAQGLYTITIADDDYNGTTYVARVSAASKQQALAMGAALIGGEMTRREWQRMGRDPHPESLVNPTVKIEPCSVDEYYADEGTVEVTVRHG